MRSRVLVMAAVVLAGGTLALTRSEPAGDAQATRAATSAAAADHCNAVEFGRFDAGPQVEGLRKGDVVHRCEPDVGAPTRLNMVVTTYGDCVAKGDMGCAPPVQVQTWPACERNLALYELYPGPNGPVHFERTSLRGAPAAVFENGRRIEVYSGATTIVVFGANRGLARAAANQLAGVERGRVVNESDDLPAPVDGAMAGKLEC
jgi:hypothetical protein